MKSRPNIFIRLLKSIFSLKLLLLTLIALLGINSILLLKQTTNNQQLTTKLHFLFKEGDKILEGLQTGPEEITVDFGKQIATGSPLVFGGVHSPDANQQEVWNKIADAGVTMIRRGFWLQYEVPQNITLEDYKNNINDIQNPSKWNTNNINNLNSIFANAKNRGMKVMGILSYIPSWLTYSGNFYGVPKDWNVYEDIIKKIYKLHRNNLDYVEVWNEPDHPSFLDVSNSGLTRDEAYSQIYFHSAKAIRDLDYEINDGKIIPIGGPALANGKSPTMLDNILSKQENLPYLNFISFHYYGFDNYPLDNIKTILRKYGKESLPIFLTEWNYQMGSNFGQEYRSQNKAVPFAGSRFFEFLKNNLAGANYYVLLPLNRPKNPQDDPYMGFYSIKNGQTDLLPQTKTWKLLSKSMKLGNGKSKIYQTSNSRFSIINETKEIGFENIDGENGIAIVNDSDSEKYYHVTLKNIDRNRMVLGKFPIDIYIASAEYDGGKAIDRIYVQPDKNNNLTFTLLLPPQSVGGILEAKESPIQEIIKSYIP